MYITRVPNRDSPPAVLLRESYREGGKVKNRTLANLSSWPEAKVEALARALKGLPPAGLEGTFEIARSLPHGHVAAVLGTARQLGLEELIDPAPSRHRDLVTAMAVAQVIAPDSKLAIARDGVPVAIEVFAGNTGGPKTVASQVDKVKDRFGITRIVLVGDRGMLTAARLREDVAPQGLDWITALRAPQVKKLVRGGDLQLTLFDQTDLAEITSPDFPGERLIACMNPFLEAERARKRQSLLAATEADLEKIAAACARAGAPLRGTDKIAVRVDRALSRRKVAKHFTVDIGDGRLS